MIKIFGERIFVVALSFAAMSCPLTAQQSETRWVASWASAQQIPEPQNVLPAAEIADATLRQIVHLSEGGDAVRVHISNVFGTQPLHVLNTHIAVPVSAAGSTIDPKTDVALRFSGAADVWIPSGAEMVSDAIPFAAAPLSSLAVSMHLESAPATQTGHPGSRATSYYAHGEWCGTPQFPAGAHIIDHWYQLASVEVHAVSRVGGAIVAFGDSITDGHGATTNGNDRWPDVLAARLQGSTTGIHAAVVNAGIGGNRLLLDGLGPNALSRLDRDVLAIAGVRAAIILEGVNDLGTATREHEIPEAEHVALVGRILEAYQQIVLRAHAHDIAVVGATITPFVGSEYYHPSARSEADRQQINAWIRKPGNFDAVADFDAVVRDPAKPERLLPKYDSGDHLHPSPAGYRAMGESIASSSALTLLVARGPEK